MIWEDYDDPFASVIEIDKSEWRVDDEKWLKKRKADWKKYYRPRLKIVMNREYPYQFWCHDEELDFLEAYFMEGTIEPSSVFVLLFLCWLHPNPTKDVFRQIKKSSECIWEKYATDRFYKLSFEIMDGAIWTNLKYKKFQGGLLGDLTIPLFEMLYVDDSCLWDRHESVCEVREAFDKKPKAPYVFGALQQSGEEFEKTEHYIGLNLCDAFVKNLKEYGFQREKRDDLEKYFITFLRMYAYHGDYPLITVERDLVPFSSNATVQIEHALCLGRNLEPHPAQVETAERLESFLDSDECDVEVKKLWKSCKEKFTGWLEHPDQYIDGIHYNEKINRWEYPYSD